jgi:ankyrin repeat protein
VATLIIESGANLDLQTCDGKTALFFVHQNESSIFEKLLSSGANVLIRGDLGTTLLEDLAEKQSNPMMLVAPKVKNFFLLLAADIDALCAIDCGERKDDQPLSAVNFAVVDRYVRFGLENYENDTSCVMGPLVLYVAIGKGFTDVATELIDKVDLNAVKFASNHTALHLACLRVPHLAMRMIERGADSWVLDRLNFTPLHLAILSGDQDLCLLILRTEAASDHLDKAGGKSCLTPLHLAALLGRRRVVERLIELGAAIDCIDSLHNTPLHLALLKRRRVISQLLISAGASTDALNKQGLTPVAFTKQNKGLKGAAEPLTP